MSFTQAVQYCLNNYFTVSGRAGRSEYWWFIVGCCLADAAASLVDAVTGYPVFGALVSLGTVIPTINAATRRLHDTDRSGWWQLIMAVPLVGIIVLIIWLAGRGTDGPNRYGAGPAAPLSRG